jgi:Kae1-associated kinase Bud32
VEIGSSRYTLEIIKDKLIKKGAEAEIWQGRWFDLQAIFKVRVPKLWRHPILDSKIRSIRTIKEAKIMYYSLEENVRVPYLYDVDLENSTIIMEYVDGTILKEIFPKKHKEFSFEIGRILSKLHSINIVHGDVTLSNFIMLNDGKICTIDFGLSEFSNRVEDKGIDIHLFLRNIESSFSSLSKESFEYFMKGYSIFMKNHGEILNKLKEIRRRGRYIAERRRVKIF